MKVLFLIDSLGAGGAERSTYQLARHLEETGHSAAIVALKSKAVGISEEFAGLRGRVVVGSGGNLRSRVAFVKRTIAEERPDIVHSVIFDSNLILRIVGWTDKTFVTVQSLVGLPYLEARRFESRIRSLKHAVVKGVDALTGRLSNLNFHVISRAVREHYRPLYHYDDDRVFLVYRGRDENQLVGGPRSFPGSRPFVLINVGRQEAVKDQVVLVQAMDQLVNQQGQTNIVLKIYGRRGGATKAIEAAIAEYALEDHVQLMGFDPAMDKAYAAGDAFLFSSLHEGMGGALVEAMAARLPCICSDIPTFREVVGEEGRALFFPVSDHQELAARVRELIASPDLYRELSGAGYRRFREAFRNESVMEQMVSMYEKLHARGI
ncbi:glycosyltransferase family 4 protein [Lewinella sp. IMCC34183]|uniref:glycosyltransferase family 4 protein n=1 Tax=Lewinella sp. IMCC34183 TaxID=2248762 RepID=UPI000E256CCB|nr:glycosyltransferase family 4 protein [Lewinella sp. IMCC34183]